MHAVRLPRAGARQVSSMYFNWNSAVDHAARQQEDRNERR
jgi:hypothetical protein